jgi:RimJ/RimL family protein N-acetyltransferase
MQLSSERLTYKKYTEADFEDYKRQATDIRVMQFISGKALTEEEAKEKFGKIMTANSFHEQLGYYSIRRNEDEKIIGLGKLTFFGSEKGLTEGKKKGIAEVGYPFYPEFWGNGYATEMTLYMCELAKKFDFLNEVIALIDPDNGASKRILTKCGFVLYDTSLYNNTHPSEWYKIKLK